MRVSYFSPVPESRSGIADYSALLLPAIAQRVEVAVARPGRFRRPPKSDVALYHVGNDPDAHGWIVEALRRRPGVVVLHDFVLHHLVAGLTLARGDAVGYLDAMERGHGLAGRLLAYGVVDNRIPPLWETRPEAFPLTGEILRLATGLVVHSRFVEDRAREAGFDGPIWRIPHPAWPSPDAAPAEIDGVPLIGCFGHLNESKRIPQLLHAFSLLRGHRPDASLVLVGRPSSRLGRLAIPEGVRWIDEYVDESRLWSLMGAADVHVSLRSPTMGETSGSAIRALALGKPLVVSDVGWFSELPDSAALKVAPDAREVEVLAAALERAYTARESMGAAALALAQHEHELGRVADRYCAALEEAAGGGDVSAVVLGDVARAAADVGLEDVTTVARRLDEAGLGR
jgi:glycosyltransferase involved in cell wall biosynthesis